MYDLGFGQMLIIKLDSGAISGLFSPRPAMNIFVNPVRDRDWAHYDAWQVIYVHIKCDGFDHRDDTGERNSWGDDCEIVR